MITYNRQELKDGDKDSDEDDEDIDNCIVYIMLFIFLSSLTPVGDIYNWIGLLFILFL